VQDICDLQNPSFVGAGKWTMCYDLQNGVKITNAVTDELDRKLLHEVGQKHGLIPLCPNEVAGLDLSEKFKNKYLFASLLRASVRETSFLKALTCFGILWHRNLWRS